MITPPPTPLIYLGDVTDRDGQILRSFRVLTSSLKFNFSPDDETFDLVKMPELLQGNQDVLKHIDKYVGGRKNTKKNRKGKKGKKGSKGRKYKSRKYRK